MTKPKTLDQLRAEKERAETQLAQEQHKLERLETVSYTHLDVYKRQLGITSTDDKLVQEVVRMILEAIYEPTFSNNSHGFRPERSCHTALTQVKKTFTGVTWIVEGDIKACFDNFDHHVLVELLRKRKMCIRDRINGSIHV